MVLIFSEYPHPIPSFRVPVPAPDVEPTDAPLVSVCFNYQWLPYVLGALTQLTLQSTWSAFDAPADATAMRRGASLIQQVAQAYNEDNSCEIVPAPYWDDSDGADADDEAPANEQDWYGVWDGETFVESMSYWAVTAFLATGVGEGAAIEFITPLRQFRLTLRRDPHGAKLLIFMDSNIFQLIDLFSPVEDTVSVDIVSPGSTLMLVNSGEHNDDATPDENGNYPIYIIRKELNETEVTPANQRVNPDTNVFQISPDGGTTWNDAPDSDPRTSPAYFLPPLTPYDGIECDVAARMTAQLKDTLDIFIETGDAAQFATGVLALAVATIPLVGWFIDLILVIAGVLVDAGQANIEDAFTEAVYDDIRCSFFCIVEANGQTTQARLDEAYDEIQARHAGIVANVIGELRLLYGDVPMVNAGVVRDETGTCDDCDCGWCLYDDFAVECPSDFTLVRGTCDGSNGVSGIYVDGSSQSATYAEISLGAPVRFTHIEFTYSGSFNGANGGAYIQGYLTGVGQVFAVSTPADGSHVTFEWNGDEIIDYFNIQTNSGTDATTSRIERVEIRGLGDAPSILTDCP